MNAGAKKMQMAYLDQNSTTDKNQDVEKPK